MYLTVQNPENDILISNGSENRGIVLVTGIANPKPLSEYLQKIFQ